MLLEAIVAKEEGQHATVFEKELVKVFVNISISYGHQGRDMPSSILQYLLSRTRLESTSFTFGFLKSTTIALFNVVASAQSTESLIEVSFR